MPTRLRVERMPSSMASPLVCASAARARGAGRTMPCMPAQNRARDPAGRSRIGTSATSCQTVPSGALSMFSRWSVPTDWAAARMSSANLESACHALRCDPVGPGEPRQQALDAHLQVRLQGPASPRRGALPSRLRSALPVMLGCRGIVVLGTATAMGLVACTGTDRLTVRNLTTVAIVWNVPDGPQYVPACATAEVHLGGRLASGRPRRRALARAEQRSSDRVPHLAGRRSPS